jgi:hypothetical protein
VTPYLADFARQQVTASCQRSFHVISDGSLENVLVDMIYTFSFPPPTFTYQMRNSRCEG